MNIPARLPMVEHALRYAAQGWPVFPCDPDNKRPLVPGDDPDGQGGRIAKTGGLYRATTDEAQIRAWWRTRPHAMIGVRCGLPIGAFVLDFDAHIDPLTGEFITAEILRERVETLIGEALPETLASITPRGGWHMLFRMPEGVELGNSRGALKAVGHVDVRGDGGYIVLAPSMRSGPKAQEEGCHGVCYRWRDEEADIAEPPARLIDALLQRGDFEVKRATPAPQPLKRMTSADFQRMPAREAAQRRYAEAALDKACTAIARAPKGMRGKTIMQQSPGIGSLISAGVLSLGECIDAFEQAGRAAGLTDADNEMGPRGLIVRFLTKDAQEKEPADLSHVGLKAGTSKRAALPPPDDEGEGYGPGFDRAGDVVSGDSDRGSVREVITDLPPPEDEGEGAPSGEKTEGVDLDAVAWCAALDTSDTDNGKRLIRHFGEDLIAREMDGASYDPSAWGVWTGRIWDFNQGAARAVMVAQQVGDRIGLEAGFIQFTPEEREAVDAAEAFHGVAEEDLPPDAAEIKAAGKKAKQQLANRRQKRRGFGVTTKNAGRIDSMLKMAFPHLRRPADAFNHDRYAVACQTHTLRFKRYKDADCAPDGSPRWASELEASEGHDRKDLITALVPADWAGADAPAPKWRAFMEWAHQDKEVRRTVQQFMGLGLLALPVQHVMLHYGTGANGKSVALEVLSRVLGPSLSVGLPQESIMGMGERAAGGASPDIARLWGKRMLRVNELKPGAPLQSELVKRLTGGESFPVRTLFKGYFEFQNVASVHMSANGKPVIDGSDYGIVRRVLMVHWKQTVPEAERRDFEEMVSEMVAEAPGILAWLAEGILSYLRDGFTIAKAIADDTAEYAREMDPFGRFVAACVIERQGARVQGKAMAEAFNSWAAANGERDKDARQVGKGVRKALERLPGFVASERIREIGGVTQYVDFTLENVPRADDVPARGARERSPQPQGDDLG